MTIHSRSDSMTWKPVKGFEAYEISDTGLVRSPTGRILSSPVDWHGYHMVSLGGRNRKRVVGVHRLLAENFLENPSSLPEVNHKNGVKTDNDLTNLEWCTHADNMRHAYDSGLNSRGSKVILTHGTTEATFSFRSMSMASEFIGKNRSYLAARKHRGEPLECGEWVAKLV